jgi:hypothetical protein
VKQWAKMLGNGVVRRSPRGGERREVVEVAPRQPTEKRSANPGVVRHIDALARHGCDIDDVVLEHALAPRDRPSDDGAGDEGQLVDVERRRPVRPDDRQDVIRLGRRDPLSGGIFERSSLGKPSSARMNCWPSSVE